ncbi:type IV toxin-antitoxin system AbiEi family antitoxin domain-containing protein [Oceanivirga salmonicida]|uniref:type IV toxin-antitoxin system AbiEi family antitoxin domain-containing protein n=1 Tax=Oceanivirga salmonicida TaxID=1769291 RepID=UPI00082AC954|nr:hypothetical protein [Oceanivirga salmonicida]
MIYTTEMILEKLVNYKSPADKLARLVKNGKYIPIIRGLYEDNKNVSPHLLAASIYGPSYISFEFALSYYGLIPERVETVTSASFEKKKKKTYKTLFGNFTFRDIPSKAFPYELRIVKDGDYYFRIASPEKALCDKLYTISPVANQNEMRDLLIEDLRIDIDELINLNSDIIKELSVLYHSTNVKKLAIFLRGLKNE